MLVLSRKSHEQIQIGPNILITIVEVRGNQVRLGIDAPVNVAVMRTELLDRLSASATTSTAEATSSAPASTSSTAEKKTTNTRRRAPRADSSPLSDHPHRSGPASSSTAMDRARNRLLSSSQRSTRGS